MPRWAKGALLLIAAALILVAVFEPSLTGGDDDDGPDSARAGATDLTGPQSEAALIEDELQAQFDEMQQRVAEDPSDVEAWRTMGALLLMSGEYGPASEAFAGAIELDDSDAGTHADLGAALLYQGMIRLARVELLRAVELDPTLPGAHFNLGITYSHTEPRDLAAAHAAWERVIELDPNSELSAQAQAFIDSYGDDLTAGDATND
jgi:cytochrome c-type biogenesis protein CcmH/NrfG